MSMEPKNTEDLTDTLTLSELHDLSRSLKDRFTECFRVHKKICKGYENLLQEKEKQLQLKEIECDRLQTMCRQFLNSNQRNDDGINNIQAKVSTGRKKNESDLKACVEGCLSTEAQEILEIKEHGRLRQPTRIAVPLERSVSGSRRFDDSSVSVSHTSPVHSTRPPAKHSPSPEFESVSGQDRLSSRNAKFHASPSRTSTRHGVARTTRSSSDSPAKSPSTSTSDKTYIARIPAQSSRGSATDSDDADASTHSSSTTREGSAEVEISAPARPSSSRHYALRGTPRKRSTPVDSSDESTPCKRTTGGQYCVTRQLSLRSRQK